MVRQSGAEASAVILRIDGDTGVLTGSYRDGKFVLSHFSGARPLRLELIAETGRHARCRSEQGRTAHWWR